MRYFLANLFYPIRRFCRQENCLEPPVVILLLWRKAFCAESFLIVATLILDNAAAV